MDLDETWQVGLRPEKTKPCTFPAKSPYGFRRQREKNGSQRRCFFCDVNHAPLLPLSLNRFPPNFPCTNTCSVGLSKRRRDTTYVWMGEGAVQRVITTTGQGKTTVSEHSPKSTTYNILQKWLSTVDNMTIITFYQQLIITSAANYSANTSFLQYIMLFTLDNVPIR